MREVCVTRRYYVDQIPQDVLVYLDLSVSLNVSCFQTSILNLRWQKKRPFGRGMPELGSQQIKGAEPMASVGLLESCS